MNRKDTFNINYSAKNKRSVLYKQIKLWIRQLCIVLIAITHIQKTTRQEWSTSSVVEAANIIVVPKTAAVRKTCTRHCKLMLFSICFFYFFSYFLFFDMLDVVWCKKKSFKAWSTLVDCKTDDGRSFQTLTPAYLRRRCPYVLWERGIKNLPSEAERLLLPGVWKIVLGKGKLLQIILFTKRVIR